MEFLFSAFFGLIILVAGVGLPIALIISALNVHARTKRLEERVRYLEHAYVQATETALPPPLPAAAQPQASFATPAPAPVPAAPTPPFGPPAPSRRERSRPPDPWSTWAPPAAPAPPDAPPPGPVPAPFAPTPQAAEPQAPAEAPQPAQPRKTIDWEVFAGGRLFSIIGAIMLIVGGGLLTKYALDHHWFPPSFYGAVARVICGFVIGLGLLVAGDRSQRAAKKAGEPSWFGHALTGAGLGLLYVSGYTACASTVIAPGVALAVMIFISAIAFTLSLRYDALPIAVIGWLGAFVTPFVVNDPNVGEVPMAIYLVLLDMALVAVALRKRSWFVLQPLALLASAVAIGIWFGEHAGQTTPLIDAIALTSTWAVFFTSGALARVRDARAATAADVLGEFGNTLIYWCYAAFALANDHTLQSLLVFGSTVLLGAAYAQIARKSRDAAARATYLGLATLGLAHFIGLDHLTNVNRTLLFTIVAFAVAGLTLMRSRAMLSAREGFAAATWMFACGALASLSAAHDIWNFTDVPLGAHVREGDLAAVLLIAGAFALDRLLAQRANFTIAGGLYRLFGAAAALTILSAHFSHFSLAIAYAAVATIAAAAARYGRSTGGKYPGFIEAPVAAAATLLLSAVVFATSHGSFGEHRGIELSDVALGVIIAALLAFERCTRDLLRGTPALSVALRAGAIALGLWLATFHAHGAGLATTLAVESIALLGIDRTMQRLGGLFGSQRETHAFSGSLILLCALIDLANWTTGRGLDFAFGFNGWDLALATTIGAAVILGYVATRRNDVVFGLAARITAVAVLLVGTAEHAHDGALATTYAIESLVFAALAWTKLRTSASRALEIEALVRAAAVAFIAIVTGVLSQNAMLTYRGHVFDFAYGGTDCTLGFSMLAAFAISRVAASGNFPRIAIVMPRQVAVAIAMLAALAHANSDQFVSFLALGAIGFVALAINAGRQADDASRIEFRIDGIVFNALASMGVLFNPTTWNLAHIVRFVPVLNDRFPAIVLTGLATVLLGMYLLRTKTLARTPALAVRAGGIALLILAATLEVRDGYGAAIALATLAGAAPGALEKLTNLQQSTISLTWVAASIVLIALGIRLRARDLRLFAIGLFDLTILKAFFDLKGDALERIIAFIVLGIVLLVVSYFYQRYERGNTPRKPTPPAGDDGPATREEPLPA